MSSLRLAQGERRPCAQLPRAVGVGLKPEHFTDLAKPRPELGFVEIHAENYFVAGGPMHAHLRHIREHQALSIHGVGLSIGGHEPLSRTHLQTLRRLIDHYQPQAFSEHLAWSSHGGIFYNDLLPLPYDGGTLATVCAHIDQVQDTLGRPMLLENPATYIEFAQSTYSEADFITEVVHRSGCGLLLDINNAHVSAINHGRDAQAYISSLPLHAVGEIHLAGFHQDHDSLGAPLLIDSHDAPVAETVWRLYDWTLAKLGPTPTLIEWDNNLPAFETLLAEAQRAQALLDTHALSLREATA